MVTNHKVKPEYDIDLAVIEGAPIEAFCGVVFVPTVIVGTSGRATDPNAPDCDACEKLYTVTIEWNERRHEKNRLLREMRALEKEHRALRREAREIRSGTRVQEVAL